MNAGHSLSEYCNRNYQVTQLWLKGLKKKLQHPARALWTSILVKSSHLYHKFYLFCKTSNTMEILILLKKDIDGNLWQSLSHYHDMAQAITTHTVTTVIFVWLQQVFKNSHFDRNTLIPLLMSYIIMLVKPNTMN